MILVLYLASLRKISHPGLGRAAIRQRRALSDPGSLCRAHQCSHRPPESWGEAIPSGLRQETESKSPSSSEPPYQPPAGEGRQDPAPHPELHPVSPWAPPTTAAHSARTCSPAVPRQPGRAGAQWEVDGPCSPSSRCCKANLQRESEVQHLGFINPNPSLRERSCPQREGRGRPWMGVQAEPGLVPGKRGGQSCCPGVKNKEQSARKSTEGTNG